MDINELMQLLKNANNKYDEDNDNYYNYTDFEAYTNFEKLEDLNYEY